MTTVTFTLLRENGNNYVFTGKEGYSIIMITKPTFHPTKDTILPKVVQLTTLNAKLYLQKTQYTFYDSNKEYPFKIINHHDNNTIFNTTTNFLSIDDFKNGFQCTFHDTPAYSSAVKNPTLWIEKVLLQSHTTAGKALKRIPYEKRTVAELKAVAAKRKIKGASTMKKADLIKALRK